MVLEENVFITQALHATVLNPLSEADLAIYSAPYPTPESRRPLLEFSRAAPIAGTPVDVLARVEAAAVASWAQRTQDRPVRADHRG